MCTSLIPLWHHMCTQCNTHLIYLPLSCALSHSHTHTQRYIHTHTHTLTLTHLHTYSLGEIQKRYWHTINKTIAIRKKMTQRSVNGGFGNRIHVWGVKTMRFSEEMKIHQEVASRMRWLIPSQGSLVKERILCLCRVGFASSVVLNFGLQYWRYMGSDMGSNWG